MTPVHDPCKALTSTSSHAHVNRRRGEWHNDQLVGWTGAEVFGDQPARLLIAAGDENGKEAAGAGGRRGAKKSPKRGPGKAVTAGGAGTERSP